MGCPTRKQRYSKHKAAKVAAEIRARVYDDWKMPLEDAQSLCARRNAEEATDKRMEILNEWFVFGPLADGLYSLGVKPGQVRREQEVLGL